MRSEVCLLMLMLLVLTTTMPTGIWELKAQEVEGPRLGGTLVIAISGDPKSFNPDSQVDDMGYPIFSVIYNKLVTLDINYNVIPDLAYKWEASPDGKVYTFYLYPNATWHDGVPVTSEDVKWTLEAIKKFKGIAYGNIKAENIEKIECPDEHTVKIYLKEPFAAFLQFLAWYGTFIMPKHIYEKYEDWMDPNNPYLNKPVGSGPFKFVEWVKGDHVTVAANEKFFKGRPYLDKIVYRIIPDPTTAVQALLKGEVDYLHMRPPLAEVPKLQKTPGINVMIRPTPSRYYIGFNLEKAPFNDIRVRRAIAMAINRTEIVRKAYQGYAFEAKGFYIPAISWAFNPNIDVPPFDLKEAEKLLDEAGYTKGPNGIRFKAKITYFTIYPCEQVCTVIRDNLKKIGIDVELEGLEIAAWEEKVVKRKEFDMALCDGFHGPDPDNIRFRYGPGAYINFAGWNNSEAKELLDEASKTVDQEERRKMYWRVQELMAEELPYIPLVDLVWIYVSRSEFHGFPWEPESQGKVGYYDHRLVWWEKGKPIGPMVIEAPTSIEAFAGDSVELKVKVTDSEGVAITNATLTVNLFKNGELIRTIGASHTGGGVYLAKIDTSGLSGDYTVKVAATYVLKGFKMSGGESISLTVKPAYMKYLPYVAIAVVVILIAVAVAYRLIKKRREEEEEG